MVPANLRHDDKRKKQKAIQNWVVAKNQACNEENTQNDPTGS
jgi:hypothetical protein